MSASVAIPGLWASASLSGSPDTVQPAAHIVAHKPRYDAVAQSSGVPWWWIGCIHQMEADGDFSCNLANGDPLTARTVNAPVGRPVNGNPPFTWEECAIDVLAYQGLKSGTVTDTSSALDRAERYNGLGYRYRGLRSPYLWSGTNCYQPGKFVADGVFDPTAISNQPGVAALMLALQYSGVVLFP